MNTLLTMIYTKIKKYGGMEVIEVYPMKSLDENNIYRLVLVLGFFEIQAK